MNQLLEEFNQRQSDQIVAFLFCDLDCCKEINASLGHSVGDAVLEITAQPMLSPTDAQHPSRTGQGCPHRRR